MKTGAMEEEEMHDDDTMEEGLRSKKERKKEGERERERERERE